MTLALGVNFIKLFSGVIYGTSGIFPMILTELTIIAV
jgi:hypothetical protein